MLDINQFPAISQLTNIETNFRVFAGPGAGKTTWLTKHLKKVLKTSERLGVTRRVACITYTNIAAEEIINRIDCNIDRLDISTIHSFLYRNIVKPFSYLIEKDDSGETLFNTIGLDGHDEHIPRRDIITDWIKKLNVGRAKNRSFWYLLSEDNIKDLYGCLSDVDWMFDINHIVQLKFRNKEHIARRLYFPNSRLIEYKKLYWSKAILHHEDVLYFSHYIISKSPRVLEFVRGKFPYIFIDEFQDTTELQTWIIKKIAEAETKVGVIGDLAQSIYKFAGAKRSDFENFELNGLRSFKMDKNHRSTSTIINFLNCIRKDITQSPTEHTKVGEAVKLLVCPINEAIKWIGANRHPDIYILTRKNESVNEIINQTVSQSDNLLEKVFATDSNSNRVKAIHSILMGYKFYQKGYLKDAIKNVSKALKSSTGNRISRLEIRKIAIEIIEDLCDEKTREKSLLVFYMNILNNLKEKYGFQIGSPITDKSRPLKLLYETNDIQNLLYFIKIDTKSEDSVRTIHSAKGTEFSSVLVHFESQRDFAQFVLNAPTHLNSDEDDSRIYYVAFSRAKEYLFLNLPEIDDQIIKKLEQLNILYELINVN